MIDHFSLRVSDPARSKKFYAEALAPLGYAVAMENGEYVGLGVRGKPDFWVTPGTVATTHVAFVADDRAAVDAFYEAAMRAGAKDNGKPGLRLDYHPSYYAAFVLDLDGHNVEAVCHFPPGAKASGAKRPAKRAKKSKSARRPKRSRR